MKRKTTKYAISLLFIIFICLITGERGKYPHKSAYFSDTDTLKTAIGIDGGMFATKGFPIGFNYRLLNKYAKNQKLTLKIQSPFSDYDSWELLSCGNIDILAADLSKDTIPSMYAKTIVPSTFITDSIVWLTRKDNSNLLYNINYYLAYNKQQTDFTQLKRQFFKLYRTRSHIENMTQTDAISPYDDIIKNNSKILGWDWRLLAALIYQESRFSMGAHSVKGATGLMQIKESTAERYGISDIFDPSSNVKAGVLHLNYLQNIYKSEGMDSVNVIKFTLASYNAGEGRMEECMNFALSLGEDYRNWDNICKVIPLMKNPSEYITEDLKFRKFRGSETINYVDNILNRYEEYLYIIR